VVPSKGPTGIDLENRADEVRKLLFAGFGTRIFAAGYDPEDVLQEVYRGLLARNAGRCAWDASKSSFGHYVHMVCSCILSNFHRRENRRRQVEQVGLPAADGEDQDVGEVASSDPRMTESVDAEADFLRHLRASGSGPDLGVAIQILPLVHQGLNRIEIAAQLHLPKGTVSRALALLKEQAARWVQ
jgi:DNA-directed RNA polymerase specialized sigma24 family protein